jgi:hypothetical protein
MYLEMHSILEPYSTQYCSFLAKVQVVYFQRNEAAVAYGNSRFPMRTRDRFKPCVFGSINCRICKETANVNDCFIWYGIYAVAFAVAAHLSLIPFTIFKCFSLSGSSSASANATPALIMFFISLPLMLWLSPSERRVASSHSRFAED